MFKRVILVMATLAMVYSWLMVYQRLHPELGWAPTVEQRDAQAPPADPQEDETEALIPMGSEGAMVGVMESVRFKTLDKGRPTRVVGFAERLYRQAGLFEFSQPWAKLYDYDEEQVIRITAQKLTSPVDVEGTTPERGQLEGGVRIEVYSLASDSPELEGAGSDAVIREEELLLLVAMEVLAFERSFSRLSSPGRVTFSSPEFSGQGEGMSLRYNEIDNRLQELKLQRDVEFYWTRQVSVEASDSYGSNGTAEDPKAIKTASKRSDDEPAQIYRVSFSDTVFITKGDERLRTDPLEILVDVDHYRHAGLEPEPSTDDTDLGTDQATDATPAENTDESIMLTSTGPLLIRPADDVSRESLEGPLVMQGYAGTPVRLWQDDRLALLSPRVSFEENGQVVRLMADGATPLRLAPDEVSWVTAEREIRIDRRREKVGLWGPGSVFSLSTENEEPKTLDYENYVELKFDTARGMKLDPLTTSNEQDLWLEEIRTYGHVSAKDPSFILDVVDEMVLTFNRKAKEKRDRGGQDRMGQTGIWLSTIVARGTDGGVRVIHRPSQKQIIGNMAKGDFDAVNGIDIWTVTGSPARVSETGASPDKEANELVGETLIATLGNGGQGDFDVEIPGPGRMMVMMQSGLNGERLAKPLPAQVLWQDGAVYHRQSDTVDLQDVCIDLMNAGSQARGWTRLTCPLGTATLARASGTDATGEVTDRLDLTHFLAQGDDLHQVRLHREEFDAMSQKLLRRMDMEVPRWEFDNFSELFRAQGPGVIEIITTQTANVDEAKPQQNLDETIARALGNSGPSYTLVTFGQQLRYTLEDHQAQLEGGVTYDQVPWPLPAGASLSDVQLGNIEGMRSLACRDVLLTLDQGVAKKLQRLEAVGDVVFQTWRDGRHNICWAESVRLDEEQHRVRFQGSQSLPVRFNEMECLWVEYDLQSGAFQLKPLGANALVNQF